MDTEDSTFNHHNCSRSCSCSCDLVPRVRDAHIGTGSRDDAAQWGVPLTVWPIGSNVRFAVWDSTTTYTYATELGSMNNGGPVVNENMMIRHDPQRFLYARGDTFRGALATKGSLAFDHDSLRAALLRGHEVLFQCAAFYVMPQQLVPPVLSILAPHGVSVHADRNR